MHEHGSKYFARRSHYPPPALGMMSIGQNSTLSEQLGSKYFDRRPPTHLTLRMGSIGHNSSFPTHGHVVYHIKGNN